MTSIETQVQVACAEASAHFSQQRPNTAELHTRAAAVMPGGNTRSVLYSDPFPIRIVRAEGATLFDADGHQYVDFVGEYSAGLFGHTHKLIQKAVSDAMAFGLNVGAHHEREIAFAESVCRRFALERVRFTNSGTEANMMALAAARCFTGKSKIMPMYGGYHGGTLYFSHGASPVNAPFECVMARYNDVAEAQALITKHSGELAAIILEPMLGGGGCIAADQAFLRMLRDRCDDYGIVLIFDEVMTSRLHPGGLAAQFGIEPDLKTLGKYIGGGMSFGSFGGRADIMELFNPAHPNALPHAGTFNNNTLTMTAGRVAIEEIYTPDVCLALNARGEALKHRLNDCFMHYQSAFQVTGIGSLLTIHPKAGNITKPEDLDGVDLQMKRLLYLHLLDEGIYIAERGYMALTLAIDDDACDALVASVERFLVKNRVLVTAAA
jgi:glutamate-1-semialdehyde 2,1-aminomutase